MNKILLLVLSFTLVFVSGCTHAGHRHSSYSTQSYGYQYDSRSGSSFYLHFRHDDRRYHSQPYHHPKTPYYRYRSPPVVSHHGLHCRSSWRPVRGSVDHSFIRTCKIYPQFPIHRDYVDRWRSGGTCFSVTIGRDYRSSYRPRYIVTERKTLHCRW